MNDVILSTTILLLAIILGILRIYKLDKGFFIQDIRLFFLISFSLYSLFLPIVYCIYSEFMSFNIRVFANMIWLYTTAIVAFDIELFTNNTGWHNCSCIGKRNQSFLIPLMFLGLLVAYSFFYMSSQGIKTFSLGEEMTSRKDLVGAVQQSWIVLTIAIAVIFNYLLFYYKQLSLLQKILFIGILLFYTSYQISLGNRREITTIFLFFVCYYLCIKKIPLNFKLLVFMVLGFIGSFLLPMVRDASTRELSSHDLVQTAILSNEFIYPQQTTYYTLLASPDYKLGYTYTILPIQVAIPRAIYPDKPATLGIEFVREILHTSQGYAYTPVTEAFVNFGYIGPFVIFYFLALFLNKLVKEANTKGISFMYMIIFAYCFDFCRSEFSSVAYSFFFIFITYKFVKFISGRTKKSAKKLHSSVFS